MDFVENLKDADSQIFNAIEKEKRMGSGMLRILFFV